MYSYPMSRIYTANSSRLRLEARALSTACRMIVCRVGMPAFSFIVTYLFGGLLLGFSITDKYLKRAGLDYWDKLEIEEHDSLKAFLEKYKPEKNNMFLASTKSKQCYSDVDYSNMEEVFILFGRETKGLPEDLILKYMDKAIRIPMRDTLRSLNLSNSVAIIVYEILRQCDFDGLKEISDYF